MNISELASLIASDIRLKQVWFLKKDTWFNRNVRVYLEPGTIAVVVYRFGSWVRELEVPVLKHGLYAAYGVAKLGVMMGFGIYVSSRLKTGRGFAIHNFSGIFLTRAQVGDNFIVFQNVTVGHLRGEEGPRLGNNVVLTSGAKVLGEIKVGDNVMVGANSLVVHDLPGNCTVVGVPARVVSRDASWIAEKIAGRGDNW